ncbi:Hypothetical protein A7982_09285 [Minicystis rosea]|nr:Hypothetical protein A7982_09285 [Minicystis rosea]
MMGTRIAKLLVPMAAVSSLALVSCAATMRDITSGKIGCPPEEVEIVKDNVGFTTRTWTATCRGRTFYCSSRTDTASTLNFNKGGMSSGFTTYTADISCTEGKPAPGDVAAGGYEGVAADAPRPKIQEAPKGAGGFSFGIDSQAAAKLCTDAGHAWDEPEKERFRCSGTAVDIGYKATSRLRFCGGKLCAVTLNVDLADEEKARWVTRYRSIQGAIVHKYGQTTARADEIAPECTSQLPVCLDRGNASMESKWHWAGGQSIRLALGRIDGEVGIGIVYRDGTQDGPKPKADGL